MTLPTVLLVEDNQFHRMGTAYYLRSCGYQVAEAADSESGWQTAVSHSPQAAIIDIVLPPQPGQPEDDSQSLGLQLVLRLKTSYPEMGIIVYSAFRDRGASLVSLMQEGYMGIAYKIKGAGTTPDSLLQALTAVSCQDVYFDPQIMEMEIRLHHAFTAALDVVERPWVLKVGENYGRLTAAEQQTVRLVGASRSTSGIAQALSVTDKSAQNYVHRVYNKLDLGAMPDCLRKTVVLAKGYTLYQMGAASADLEWKRASV